MPGFEQIPDSFKCQTKNHLQEIDARASIQINMVYLSYFNDTQFFVGVYLAYIHFSNFGEGYETLANTCIQFAF